MELVTGVEPATSSLHGNRSACTRLHSSPLTCGNVICERHYDGLGTASTATELHRAAPPTAAELLLLRLLSDWPGSSVTPPTRTHPRTGPPSGRRDRAGLSGSAVSRTPLTSTLFAEGSACGTGLASRCRLTQWRCVLTPPPCLARAMSARRLSLRTTAARRTSSTTGPHTRVPCCRNASIGFVAPSLRRAIHLVCSRTRTFPPMSCQSGTELGSQAP